MIEKYSIANSNIIPVLEVVLIPSRTKSPMFPSLDTPDTIATKVKIKGMTTKEVNGDIFHDYKHKDNNHGIR